MRVIMCYKFNFRIAHIAGSINTAADFLSRLELKVTEKIRLKIREDIKTLPIEVHTSSSDVADEEQCFFTPQDNEDAETEEQTLARKAEAKNKALRQCVNQTHDSVKISVKELIMVRANKAAYAINGIKHDARIRAEQGCGPSTKEHEAETTRPAPRRSRNNE